VSGSIKGGYELKGKITAAPVPIGKVNKKE
jgi:hypothetical protein